MSVRLITLSPLEAIRGHRNQPRHFGANADPVTAHGVSSDHTDVDPGIASTNATVRLEGHWLSTGASSRRSRRNARQWATPARMVAPILSATSATLNLMAL
jgi:hypothetical protein